MDNKFILMIIALLAIMASDSGQAQVSLQLKINGDLVAGPGDVESFSYSPGQSEIKIHTFHEDIRCDAVSPEPEGNITLVLDRVEVDSVEQNEEDASYSISLDGSISYNIQDGVGLISISTAAIDDTVEIDCTHKFPSVGKIQSVAGVEPPLGFATLGAIAVKGFEEMFDLSVLPAPGNDGINLILENRAPLFVAKRIRVPLQLELTTGQFPQPGPTFTSSLIVDNPDTPEVETQPFGKVNLQSGDWEIPEFWPFETAMLEIRYADLRSGDKISLDVDNVETQDRELSLPTLVTVVNTSTKATIK